MHQALVIGSSGGIGRALSVHMAQNGFTVTNLSRRDNGLDITDEAQVAAALSPLQPPFDRIIVASGALAATGAQPEKSLRSLRADNLAAQFAVNAIGPALVLKHAVRLLPRGAPSQFAALSARVGSIGDNELGGWYAYRASKAALNQLLHTAAIELARTHPRAICVALHPGTVATQFTRDYRAHKKVSPETAAAHLCAVLDNLQPSDSGGFFDWRGIPVPW